MTVRDLVPWGRRSPAAGSSGNGEHPFFSLQRDVNRVFEDLFKGFDVGLPTESMGSAFAGTWPRLEVTDDDKAIRITAELPGMEEKDVELFLEDDILTLRGERRAENEDAGRHFSERFYGRFERRIRLGYDIDQEKVEARFKNGVLDIVLPKDQVAQSRVKRIPLKT